LRVEASRRTLGFEYFTRNNRTGFTSIFSNLAKWRLKSFSDNIDSDTLIVIGRFDFF
jgi:hypothetical protein